MTVTSNSEFAKRVTLLARPAEQFKPTATYDPDGDCIEFLAKPDPSDRPPRPGSGRATGPQG